MNIYDHIDFISAIDATTALTANHRFLGQQPPEILSA